MSLHEQDSATSAGVGRFTFGTPLDKSGRPGSRWLDAIQVKLPDAEHGPRLDRKGSLLLRSLRWAGNQVGGCGLVRSLGWNASAASGHSQEQAGNLHLWRCKQMAGWVGYERQGAVYFAAGGAALILGLSGCGLMGVGRIAIPGVSVTGVKDAGTPAVVAKSDAGTVIPLPAGSEVTLTKYEAIDATKETPAQAAREVTEIHTAGPTEYRKTESKTAASTGTVDTSIALKGVEAGESRPLLYASILAALAAGAFVYLSYPTPAICCGGASVVFFAAWKLSDLPPWFWALGLAAIAGGVMLWLGHEKGLTTPKP